MLLHSELFNWLIGGLHPDPGFRQTSRAMVQDGSRDFGWTEAQFWSDLDALTRDYAGRAAKRSALQMRIDRAPRSEQRELGREAERLDRAFCQARVLALESAREHFGREKFDRFLYTVVAPGLVVSPTSPAAGVTALDTHCHWTGRRDGNGNTLRYEALARRGGHAQAYYDVFFSRLGN